MTEYIVKHFTESVYYDLEQTARYCKFLGLRMYEKLNSKVTPDEFAALDTISIYPEICQRDLAKLILKDRANTGRILNSLEEKGYITRPIDTKNNRLVRKMVITDKGYEVIKETTEKVKDYFKLVTNKITEKDINHLQELLKNLRKSLSEIVEMQI